MVLGATQALWYLTRATGLVSLTLLTVSVVLGITEAVRWAHPRWPRFVTAGLHKNVSLLVTAFLVVHIVTAVADSFAPIRWLDAIVPFRSAYRPVWIGFGAVAVDLLIALIVTSLLRRRLGYRAWRAVHWAAYGCWPVALLHGLGTGTDSRVGWALTLQAACLALVAGAVAWRLARGWTVESNGRVLGAVWGAVAVVGIVAFALAGPLRPGWARRAGTPSALLASARTAAAGAAQPVTAASPAPASEPAAAPQTTPGDASARDRLGVPFTASLQGSLTETPAASGGSTTVTIAATLRDGAVGRLVVELRGQALPDGGVEMQSSSARLGTATAPDQYRGQLVSLSGSRMLVALQDAQGTRIELSVRLQIDEASGAVSGTAQARPAGIGDDDVGRDQ